jgi:hypothetical protein
MGAHDHPPPRLRHLPGELPHVTAAVIEGAAHAINFSHPEQPAHVVRSYLTGMPIVADPSAKGGVRVFEMDAQQGSPS